MTFSRFALSQAVLDGVNNAGYTTPMPIQEEAIPSILEGSDVVGCAQTGTGKTAAFLLPIIELLHTQGHARRYRPRALVLSPTRELAAQVVENFEVLASGTGLRATAITGGVDIGPQEVALGGGVELVVATPGRLREHLSREGLKFTDLQVLVLDEADRLLDAGFLPDVRHIVDRLPERRQTLLFSATMPLEIEQLAHAILRKPKRIQVGLIQPRDSIREEFYPVSENQKTDLLRGLLAREDSIGRMIVFVRTRARAASLTPVLAEVTNLPVGELHGDLEQQQRNETLESFRSGHLRLLVATDVASRGLDIVDVTHIVNFDVPNTAEDYIHRIGRTARADRSGVAFTLVSLREMTLAEKIRGSVRRPIQTERIPGFPYEELEDDAPSLKPGRSRLPRQFHEREGGDGRKPSPFTKSGGLRRRHQDQSDPAENQRNRKKRIERKAKRKLPHKRRKR